MWISSTVCYLPLDTRSHAHAVDCKTQHPVKHFCYSLCHTPLLDILPCTLFTRTLLNTLFKPQSRPAEVVFVLCARDGDDLVARALLPRCEMLRRLFSGSGLSIKREGKVPLSSISSP